MNKLITLRNMISGMLIFIFSMPAHAQEWGGLEGRVQNENGDYMAGVTIDIISDEGKKEGTGMTDADGRYRIQPLHKGVYKVVGHVAAYENTEIENVLVSGSTPGTLNLNFTPLVFSDITECGRVKPIVLEEPAERVALSGTLKDAFNRPAAGVTVEVWINDTTLWCEAVTSDKGCYKIHDIEPGKYLVVTDFNGVKTVSKVIVVKEEEYVDEIVTNLYFNRKKFDNHGTLVSTEATVMALDKNDIKHLPFRN